MDATQLIVELAKQIEAQQAYHQIGYWLAIAAVSFLAGGAGAYVSTYLKKRAETSAIEADIKKILEHQATITRAVKEVEAEISHADWRKREAATLRRLKLEELMLAIADVGEWAHERVNQIWFPPSSLVRSNPLIAAQSLGTLYFGELTPDISRLSLAQYAMVSNAFEEQGRRWTNATAGVLPTVDGAAIDRNGVAYASVVAEIGVLQRKIPAVMNSILGDAFGRVGGSAALRNESPELRAAS